ncbi:MAG: hypothetical protein IBJ11_01740 [Phycisphaerales bacterium]|nr:hypothetical protein [Phycisphaerales bacterium]
MPNAYLDATLQRKVIDGFEFPLGVEPVDALLPKPGYVVEFEPADGGAPMDFNLDGADVEEWPDRLMYDIVLPAPRARALFRMLMSLAPARVFPIVDVLGNDAYREIDPYIAYDLVGLDRFYEGMHFFGDWFFEDGLVGVGLMSPDPFFYLFLDEHKLVTLRVEPGMKDRVEKLLAGFDLGAVTKLEGVDSVAHEHRSVITLPSDKPDALTPDEVLERLRAIWLLQLNIDPHTNVDDEDHALGVTGWRCLVRCLAQEDGPDAYAEVMLAADCLDTCERLAAEAVGPAAPGKTGWLEVDPIQADRVTPEEFARLLRRPTVDLGSSKVHAVRWIQSAK